MFILKMAKGSNDPCEPKISDFRQYFLFFDLCDAIERRIYVIWSS